MRCVYLLTSVFPTIYLQNCRPMKVFCRPSGSTHPVQPGHLLKKLPNISQIIHLLQKRIAMICLTSLSLSLSPILQELQEDINKHAEGIKVVLTMCDLLQGDKYACTTEKERDALQLAAINLERRWETIQAQARDLQCGLELKLRTFKVRTRLERRQKCPWNMVKMVSKMWNFYTFSEMFVRKRQQFPSKW